MNKNLIIVSLCLIFLISVISAVPLPHAFYGNVDYSNGESVEGVITAKIDESIVGRCDIVSGFYDLIVNSEYGGLIYFYLEGKNEPIGTFFFDAFEVTELNFIIEIPEPYCGDGYCENDEDCSSCPADCGVCPPKEYNLSLFHDLDTCRSGIIGDLDLKLKDPDDGDEFGVGDKIEIKVDVENNADEDKDIVVEVILYNIDQDDVEEETDDEEEIRDGKDETFEFVFDVPEDFEDDNYVIYVKAYEDNEEELQCVEGAIDIELEREKHEVIIKDFSINPLSVTAGKSFDVFTEVQNIGESDEDVYVVVEIKELGVLTESETFELEEFGEDDSFSETFSVKVPENAKKGAYEVEIRVVFDGEEDEKIAMVSVLERVPVQLELIDLIVKKLPKVEKIDLTIKKLPEVEKIAKVQKVLEIPPAIPIALSIGIIILIILIVVVARVKRNF